MFRFLLFLLVLTTSFQVAYAQQDSLAQLLGEFSEDDAYVEETLSELKEYPVDINAADKEELSVLPFVNGEMADSIIAARKQRKTFSSKRQIRKILGDEVYHLIKEYVTIHAVKTDYLKVCQRNTYKLEKDPEIQNGKYAGDPFYSYSRATYQHKKNLKAGIVIQKDPGETQLTDHSRISVLYKKHNFRFLFGDFYVMLGLGLTYSNPYGLRKSILTRASFGNPADFARMNLSSAESFGKRGIFVSYSGTSNHIFVFGSLLAKDVRLSDDYITGLRYDGYHRTQNELASQRRINELSYGVGAEQKIFSRLLLGVYAGRYNYDPEIENSFRSLSDDQKRRQYFAFSGNALQQVSSWYSFYFNRLVFAGEFATSDKGKSGWTQSLFFEGRDVTFGIRLWYLNKNFQSPDGRLFDRSDPFPQGEKGFYGSLNLKPVRDVQFYFFKLYRTDTWRTYFNPLPVLKNEWLTQADYSPGKWSFSGRYRSRQQEYFSDNTRRLEKWNDVRTEIAYKANSNIALKTRWEHVWFTGKPETGTLIFQDIRWRIMTPIKISMRFTFFQSGSYDSRIYEYENDLPGSFSNYAMFDNGNKYYLMLDWQLSSFVQFWFKWRYVSHSVQQANGKTINEPDRQLRTQINFIF